MNRPSPLPPRSSACRALAAAVETYLDGELDPSQVVDVETHLAECGCCRERVALDRAVRESLRRSAQVKAPSSLQERVRAAMEAERQNTAPSASERRGDVIRPVQLQARYLAPFAIAACFALVFSVKERSSATRVATAGAQTAAPSSYAAASMMGIDGILDDLVTQHATPLPPEVTQADDLRAFDPFIGVPVEAPKLQPFGAKWVGGRMLPVRDQRAAMLQYQMAGGHRVTVYVYDPRRVKPESRSLRELVVRNSPVLVGNVRGYNVAAAERKGVGYALATDLDEPESAELVAAAGVP
jgi:mycothiol system anti-sigma-R factor